MKNVLLILGILIFLDITYFSYINQGGMLTINYKPFMGDFVVGSGIMYFIMGVYGMFGGALIVYSRMLGLQKDIKGLARKTEKSSIVTEESQDKVKALEAKVNTLEAALKAALGKNK